MSIPMKKIITCLAVASLASISLIFLSGYPGRLAPWQYDRSLALSSILFAAAVFIGTILLWTRFFRFEGKVGIVIRTFFIILAVCAPIVTILLLLQSGVISLSLNYNYVVMMITSLVLLLLLNVLFKSKHLLVLLINVGVLIFAIIPSTQPLARKSLSNLLSGQEKIFQNLVHYASSSIYDVKVSDFILFESRKNAGGGLGIVDDERVLLVTGDGEIHILNVVGDQVNRQPGMLKTPFDPENYRKTSEEPSRFFRVTDALLEETDSPVKKLYVAYHHWDENKKCVSLNVAESTIDFTTFGESELDWEVIFSSSPCLTLFISNTSGGRMDFYGDSSLLLTIGTTISWGDADDAPVKGDYGKIISIDRKDRSNRILTSGHRNPQGLVSVDGEIWSTEHGPQGGDELNFISEGNDYGWPVSSYGTQYGTKSFGSNEPPGEHTYGERPVYSWIPSIGISNLIRVKGKTFKNWNNDLLVASLYGSGEPSQRTGKSLYRVRVFEKRAVLVERINTGRAIRDLIELPDGRIALWEGLQVLQIVEPQNIAFSACNGCHTVTKPGNGNRHGIGPDLRQVVGARVARHKYYEYSDAMKNFGGKWTADRLDKFLENPGAVVPGTTMSYPGVKNDQHRREIIEYLTQPR